MAMAVRGGASHERACLLARAAILERTVDAAIPRRVCTRSRPVGQAHRNGCGRRGGASRQVLTSSRAHHACAVASLHAGTEPDRTTLVAGA